MRRSPPVWPLARAEWKEKSVASLRTDSRSLNMEPLSLGGVRAGGGFSLVLSLAGLTLGMGWESSSEKVTWVAAPRPGLPRGSGLLAERGVLRIPGGGGRTSPGAMAKVEREGEDHEEEGGAAQEVVLTAQEVVVEEDVHDDVAMADDAHVDVVGNDVAQVDAGVDGQDVGGGGEAALHDVTVLKRWKLACS